jgi:hypothetical protein
MVHPEHWSTTELFDYALEHDLIPENSEFEDYMNNRSDLYQLVSEHFDNR